MKRIALAVFLSSLIPLIALAQQSKSPAHKKSGARAEQQRGRDKGPAEALRELAQDLIDKDAAARAEALKELRAKKLGLPVAGVDPELMKGSFYQGRGTGRQHNAADIMAPSGTPIYAVEDGIVARLFTSEAGGITLYQTDLPGHFVYYYAHLDSYAPGLTQGHRINKGDLIGFVGSTGNASPDAPHLHFAIWQTTPDHVWSGLAIDPYDVFRGAAPQKSIAIPKKGGTWI